MKERPLISVLMGIYNCSDTLEEAVECIIQQTYNNWELIMCDDCSTDNTFEIAKALEAKDHRIHVFRNKSNLTLAPTLNHCLRHAIGQYVARMDGDDVCSRERFEKELEFLEQHSEYALVSCQMNLFDSKGIYKVIKYMETPTKESLVRSSQFCHAGSMMRSDTLRLLGGYSEEKSCYRVEDYNLWVRLYAAGYMGYNLQEPLYSMRDDRNAVKRRTFSNRLNESRVKILACKEYDMRKVYYKYAMIPIIKAFIPTALYRIAHRK